MSFTFRPLARGDLETLHRWFTAPHASPWVAGRAIAEVEDDYRASADGESAVRSWVALHGGRDIALVSWERFADSPELARAYGVDDPGAANCDVLIGEPDALHRGLGAPMIRAFLRDVMFADPRVTACVIDPQPDNAISIRAYEKAGFRFTRALADDGEGNAIYLMELGREHLDAPPRPGLAVRPGRPDELATALAIDDDACGLFTDLGMGLDLPPGHPYPAWEERCWRACAARGRLLFACDDDGAPLGFVAYDFVDGIPYVHQLSVRRAAMRRGVGRALLERAVRWSVGHGELWLSTYAHVPWNAPWYARVGFEAVSRDVIGPELRAIDAGERGALPSPEHRVIMRLRHAGRA